MSLAVGSLFDNEFIYWPGRFFMAATSSMSRQKQLS